LSPNDIYLVPGTEDLLFEDENVATDFKNMFLEMWKLQYPEDKLKDNDFMNTLWRKARKLIEFLIDIISHERVDAVYLLKHTQKVIDYGSLGMDIYFDNISIPCRIEDILDVKYFIRWAIPNFKAIVDITPDEYKQICVNWIKISEKATIIDNPLTDPFTESFINEILRAKIYYGWNQDGVNEIYMKKEARIIFVVKDRAYISSTTIQNLVNSQRTPIKIEKVREILRDFYISSEIKHLYADQNDKKESFGRRFWVFDWEKLKKAIPNLDNKILIVDEMNIAEQERIYKKISDVVDNYHRIMECSYWHNLLADLVEYINKYNLSENEYAKALMTYISDENTKIDCNIEYAIEILEGLAKIFRSLTGK